MNLSGLALVPGSADDARMDAAFSTPAAAAPNTLVQESTRTLRGSEPSVPAQPEPPDDLTPDHEIAVPADTSVGRTLS
jgi:hypothetical protein